MKYPSELIWGLTKNSSRYIVKRGGNTFSSDPLSLSNLHNKSDSGISRGNGVSITVSKQKVKNGSKRVFELKAGHQQRNNSKHTNSQVYSITKVNKEVNHAAKVINKLKVGNTHKAKILHRLAKVHIANANV
jgi:hypothetical protein